MCGICGIFDHNARRIDRGHIMNMCAAMEHRGPDDFGYWAHDSIVLGHRRLSIIDLTTGHQPITNEDGSLAVVVNGEIYNYRALRDQMIAKGHRFATQSDSEVLVHLYEEYGFACLQELRGMFAFALWDSKEKMLFCARDRMGQKPFYYCKQNYKGNTRFMFASELEALLAEGSVAREIDQQALYYYLTYGYVQHPRTIYNGVCKLPPAHYLTIKHGDMKITRYWSYRDAGVTVPHTEGGAKRELRKRLEDATRIRMVSDVPLGAFLSGGIDSSIVVGLMSRMSSQQVKTFSIGFEHEQYNELPYARMVAKHFKTDHTEFIVKPNMVDILPGLVKKFGEPFADTSCIPTYYVSKLTRQKVTVALNGDGSDELFAGYDRYYAMLLSERIAHLARMCPEKWRQKILGYIPARDDQKTFLFRARRFLEGLPLPADQRYKRWMSQCTARDLSQVINPEFAALCEKEGAEDAVLRFFAECGNQDVLRGLLHMDLNSYLPGDLLPKVDISSMAHSLEARSPFLDHKVVEFVWAMRSRMKMRGRQSKYILKKAYAHLLPKQIFARKKAGFGVPVGQWFRTDLKDYVHDALLAKDGLVREYFNVAHVRQMLAEHSEGQWNHERPLVALLMLALWDRHCFRGK